MKIGTLFLDRLEKTSGRLDADVDALRAWVVSDINEMNPTHAERQTGIPGMTLWRWANGKGSPTLPMCLKYARARLSKQ